MNLRHTSVAVDYWQIRPRRGAADLYPRKYRTRDEAEYMVALMKRRVRYKVVGFNRYGKVVL